ncbi:MAG: hypothetical protein HUU35_02735 [Armatimonadetes bacterium]|nr:hypothetical protein [Armatimonadota bacterium]
MAPVQRVSAVDLAVLEELGEWAALGFYEALDLPWPRSYGRALRRLYERAEVRVPEGHLLIPCEPLPGARTMASHGVWSATALICDVNHHCGLRLNHEVAAARRAQFPQHAAAIDALMADLAPRLPHFGGYTHSNPDIRRVVTEGFDAMDAELAAELAAAEAEGDHQSLPLLHALVDYAAGVRAFHQRSHRALTAAAAAAPGTRRDELSLIAESFGQGFLRPAPTFLAGLLAVNFTWMLDFCDSIGRFDQALGPLYEADLAAGRLDPSLAERLLDEFWASFERLNGWNLQLGGYTPDGRDGANALTIACLEACRRQKLRRPNVALRLTRETPEAVLRQAISVLGEGGGRPALYHDELYLRTLQGLDLGLRAEDARELGFGGCTETMIGGMSNVGSLEGELNLARCLELALHGGRDRGSGRQEGPATGEFAAMSGFEQLLEAVREQIRAATTAFVAQHDQALRQRFTEGDPKLYRTFFTRDCVRRRRSFEAGGARYNWAVVSYQGIANLIDSLAAVQQVVFVEQALTPAELLVALEANFEGHERLRQRLLQAPKFGNDQSQVDALGAELLAFAWGCLLAHPTPRGGRYLPSCILFATYGQAGRAVGATPDGRRAGEPLTDSVGPAQGRDVSGPTAMLRSVASLPLTLAVGTPVLNIRFQKSLLATATGIAAVADLVRTFFAAGGLQLQISVLDRAELLAAQRHPERYRDLIVRIGGYSEYFTRLDPGLQASVIARTEHGF